MFLPATLCFQWTEAAQSQLEFICESFWNDANGLQIRSYFKTNP